MAHLFQLIQRRRQEMGKSQADLARLVNQKSSVIQGYESGNAIPNNVLLGQIERALGIKLRGALCYLLSWASTFFHKCSL